MVFVRWSSVGAQAFFLVVLGTRPASAADATVKVDGSSTVYPITEAMAEEFQKTHKNVHITVGAAGTGAGFKKFCAGEIDISDGSRGIKPDELAKCRDGKVEPIELPIAFDGLTVVVNPKNTFIKSLSFAQLKKIWEPGSKVKKWKDVDPSWPDVAIKLYGPSSEHGTFDYFTEEVVGKAKSSRADYNAAADTNTLVSGVAGDANALGYFGYAYYLESKSKVRAVPVMKKDGTQGTLPNADSIADGSYPLARPLFITVSKAAATRAEVNQFVLYYLETVSDLAKSVGYVPLPAQTISQATKKYNARQVGAWQAASH